MDIALHEDSDPIPLRLAQKKPLRIIDRYNALLEVELVADTMKRIAHVVKDGKYAAMNVNMEIKDMEKEQAAAAPTEATGAGLDTPTEAGMQEAGLDTPSEVTSGSACSSDDAATAGSEEEEGWESVLQID